MCVFGHTVCVQRKAWSQEFHNKIQCLTWALRIDQLFTKCSKAWRKNISQRRNTVDKGKKI